MCSILRFGTADDTHSLFITILKFNETEILLIYVFLNSYRMDSKLNLIISVLGSCLKLKVLKQRRRAIDRVFCWLLICLGRDLNNLVSKHIFEMNDNEYKIFWGSVIIVTKQIINTNNYETLLTFIVTLLSALIFGYSKRSISSPLSYQLHKNATCVQLSIYLL